MKANNYECWAFFKDGTEFCEQNLTMEESNEKVMLLGKTSRETGVGYYIIGTYEMNTKDREVYHEKWRKRHFTNGIQR